MNLKNESAWRRHVIRNTDHYGALCVNIARRVMEKLDSAPQPLDVKKLLIDADNEVNHGSMTHLMAFSVAKMVIKHHVRGEEFRDAWNKTGEAEEAPSAGNGGTDGVDELPLGGNRPSETPLGV